MFNTLGTFGTLATSQTCQTFLTFYLIYICRYFADKQLFFLTVNTFIYWIFNVMFNPVHHHCHPFTDFHKGLICAEFRPLLTVRKSDTPILWRACLLVVPAGLNPRIYNIKTLHFNNSVDNVPSPICLFFKNNKTSWKYLRGYMEILK